MGILKDDYPIESIFKFIKRTDNHPVVKKYFFGTPFPKSLERLGQSYFSHKINFEKELGILILTVLKYKKEIDQYIIIRENFEVAFLLGNYADANNYLNIILKEFGYSLWFLEKKFLLEEAMNGLEGNKEFLNSIGKDNSNSFPAVFAYFLSIRSELKISVINYNTKLNSFVEDLNNDLKDYLNFKLDFLEKISEFKDLTNIVFLDSIFPIIDRYETLVKICQITLIDKNYLHYQLTIKKLTIQLIDRINDPILNNVLLAYGLNKIHIQNTALENLNIYENYTIGKYAQSAQDSKDLLDTYPTEISYYEIYVKSLFYLGKNKSEISTVKKLANYILSYLWDIFSQNEDYKKSLLKLKKVISNHENTSWARQLFSLIRFDINKNNDIEYECFRHLNSNKINPLFYKVFLEKENSLNYLIALSACVGNLSVVKLFSVLENSTTEEDLDSLNYIANIPEYRRLFYSAKAHDKIGSKKMAAILNLRFLESFPNYFILYQEALYSLLKCYISLNEYNAFLKLYVLSSFKNMKLKLPPEQIQNKIEAVRFAGVDKTIYLPIFYYLTTNDNHIINLTVRHFLRSYGCKIPTEIISYKESFELQHLVFFLRNICTQEILKYFTHFKGTKEILNERLGICRILLAIDKENENRYNEEIGSIAKSIVIIEGMRQVDESKIFVDEKALRLNELKETKNNFERYISISEMFGGVDFVVIDLNNLKQFFSNVHFTKGDTDKIEKIKQEGNVKYSYFKELFLAIRDKFLFNSKYGLDTYLSTRIRHGTLLGQIRNKFQDYHLITQKDKDGIYFENEYWSNKISIVDKQTYTDFQSSLSNFSSKVDSLTNQLKNDLIQVRTEIILGSGLFDYIYPDSILYSLFISEFQTIKDYELFLDQIFIKLWAQTNNNLSLIREYIATSLKEEYISYLTILENELKSFDSEFKIFQELINNIIRFKTDLSYELDKISDWFQIKQTNVKDFLIDKAIDTSIEITNRISVDVRILNVKKSIKSRSHLNGHDFISYFDLLRIFFDNMTKYSGNTSDTLKVHITVEEKNNFMYINIINSLNDTSLDNIERIKQIFNSKRADLNSPDWDMERIKREGNTGFYKAKKILFADLQSDNNEFHFKVNDNMDVEIDIIINLNSKSYENFTDRR